MTFQDAEPEQAHVSCFFVCLSHSARQAFFEIPFSSENKWMLTVQCLEAARRERTTASKLELSALADLLLVAQHM